MKKGILLFFAGSILGAAAVCGVLVLLTKPGESIPLEGEPPVSRPDRAELPRRPIPLEGEPPVSRSEPRGSAQPRPPITRAARQPPQLEGEPAVSRPDRKPKFNFDEPHLKKKVKHFTGVTEESFDEKIAELDTLKDQAKAGSADALRTLMALADAGICMGEDVVKRLAATGKPEAGEFLLRLTRKPEPCIPLAARELGMIDTAADLEYGSQLVALVKAVGNPRAATMLEKYADRLRKKRPKDKLRAKYFDGKIEEAMRTAEELRMPPEPPPPP